jgi:hypothetical protein
LARRVVCTWVDPSREDGHPVLPDACIDLVWDGATLVVAGPDTQAWWVTSQSAFVGIRFQPGSAPGFLGVPASELLNQALPLSEFWGHSQADRLAERLAECGSDIAACKVLESVCSSDRLLPGLSTIWWSRSSTICGTRVTADQPWSRRSPTISA